MGVSIGLFVCLGIVLLVVAIAVVIVVLVMVLQKPGTSHQTEEPWTSRRERRGGQEPQVAGASAFSVRLGEDGFWLISSSVATGATVQYRCRVRGALEQGSVTFEPGPQGQFVYTGGRPSHVEILQVLPPRTTGPLPTESWEPPLPPVITSLPPSPPPPPPPPPPPQPRSKPFSGFPTAY